MREYLIYTQSLENFIIDLSSYVLILVTLLFLLLKKYIDRKLFIFFSFYSLTPFFFNDILFSSDQMWDQYTNSYYLIDLRNHVFTGNYFDNYFDNFELNKIKFIVGSHLYGLMPFLYIASINTIAFMNKLLICLTSIYLLKKNYIRKPHLFFLLLFPSSIIYSSLSLKELFLGITCIWIFLFLYEKKYLYASLLLIICFFIRPLFYTFIAGFIFYYFISLRLSLNKSIYIIFNFFILIVIIFFSDVLLSKMNHLIKTYNQEDVGWGGILNQQNISFINFSLDSILINFKIIINKLILNWPVPLKFKVLFLFENIILFYFITKNFKHDYNRKKFQTILSIFYLIVVLSCFNIIFPNLLPLHRYLYPYIFFYLFFSKFRLNNENYSYNK